jgi:hypothetical protein
MGRRHGPETSTKVNSQNEQLARLGAGLRGEVPVHVTALFFEALRFKYTPSLFFED